MGSGKSALDPVVRLGLLFWHFPLILMGLGSEDWERSWRPCGHLDLFVPILWCFLRSGTVPVLGGWHVSNGIYINART